MKVAAFSFHWEVKFQSVDNHSLAMWFGILPRRLQGAIPLTGLQFPEYWL
jgi:hypothetical protein